ncbi:MAG: tetratricopeptide repeat protein [Sulfurospirillum sp.]|nr:tetratricopeptide repeat protein [Sulfurospirillum sp.]
MGNFFIEYRDPLFGLIILFCVIFIISFANYWWGAYKNKEEKHGIEQFIKKFEILSDQDEYKKLLKDVTIPKESLALLAHSYAKSGDYEKAIGLYLLVLEQTNERKQKEFLLLELGKTYFRAGFLRRSEEIFLEALRLHPRNEEALKFLSVSYEKLKEHEKAIEVLNALEELGAKVTNERAYLQALQITYDFKLSDAKKMDALVDLAKKVPFLQRKVLEFAQIIHKPISISLLDSFILEDCVDLLWYMDEDFINLNDAHHIFVQQIQNAKGKTEDFSGNFAYLEFAIMAKLHVANYHDATLNFEYLCDTCKHTFPIHFYRCPNCHSIAKAKIIPIITTAKHEKNISFQ